MEEEKADDEKNETDIAADEAAASAPNPMAKPVEKTDDEKKIEAAAEEFKDREGEVKDEDGLKAQKKKIADMAKSVKALKG